MGKKQKLRDLIVALAAELEWETYFAWGLLDKRWYVENGEHLWLEVKRRGISRPSYLEQIGKLNEAIDLVQRMIEEEQERKGQQDEYYDYEY